MKKKNIILYCIIALVVTITSIATYFYFKKSPDREIWHHVPHNAAFIIETNNLTDGWQKLSEGETWKHLMNCKLFESINKRALSLDSLLKDNETLDMLFTNRPMLISCHTVENSDFDFLFLIDLKQGGKFAFLKNYIKGIVDYFGYDMNTERYENESIIVLTDKKNHDDIFISIMENVFAISYNRSLIEMSIESGKDKIYWDNNKDFTLVKNEISKKSLFKLYANYKNLATYLNFYFDDQNDLLQEMGRILAYSAFDIDLENTKMGFSGYTKLNDSCNSYINILSEIEPAERFSQKIIPENIALFMSLTFKNYMDLFNKMKQGFTFSDSTNNEKYEKSISRIEKYFGINLEKDFFSWIGNEICLIKPEPEANSTENDAVIAIHSSDMSKTIMGMEKICKKISHRSPIKIKDSEYHGHIIKYFAIKDFFKIFFGKMFEKIEKPYFTYLDNFVVFSNNSSCLIDFIDANQNKKVLENNESFNNFISDFEDESNVTIYINGPRAYKHLYHFSKNEKKKMIANNKEVIVSFKNIGFQLKREDNNFFKSKMEVEHSKEALYETELENIENDAEKLYLNEFDTLIDIEIPNEIKDGQTFLSYWENDSTKIKSEGKTEDGKKSGMWRYYYKSGNMWGTIVFEEGEPNKMAILFYDEKDPKMKSQIEYDNGKIVGTYKEFYSNGERKSQIEYDDGLANGKAEFFYDSGILKIEGEYKDGVKKGKWKHYTEIGDLMSKEKWKKTKKSTLIKTE